MGELAPVTPDSHGAVKLVSVLVSVADPLAPNSLLHPQFGLEAEAGIEPANRAFAEPCLTTWLPRHRIGFPNQSFNRILRSDCAAIKRNSLTSDFTWMISPKFVR